MPDEQQIGRRVITEVMGAEHMARRDRQRNNFNAALQDLSTEVAFGRVWSRPGIDRKTRSMITLGILTALGRATQLSHHVDAAVNNGCTAEEVREALLHAAIYCGLPAAGDAFKTAEDALRARGLIDD
jgi:4-carboxymuconolactone decarboxylase